MRDQPIEIDQRVTAGRMYTCQRCGHQATVLYTDDGESVCSNCYYDVSDPVVGPPPNYYDSPHPPDKDIDE